MDAVTVPVEKLVRLIRANRDAHHELFLKAQEGFKARVLEELDTMLQLARERREFRLFVGLTPPQDHTADYDRALGMLELCVNETIELDYNTYCQLVRNEWAWFQQTTVMNSTYASGGKLGTSHA